MKNIFKIFSLLLLFLILSNNTFSQISVASYNFNILELKGTIIKFNEQNIDVGAKFFSNMGELELPTEFDLIYNFKAKEYHRFFAGVGLYTDFKRTSNLYAIFPVGLEVFPFQNFKKVSFLFEFSLQIKGNNGNHSFRNLTGVRYTFGDK